ncbi:T9SS type A sorting domain-containing protein, partial [Bacteroidota bacterium]
IVRLGENQFEFNQDEYNIETVRPDIFAPGYFSMFDAILAVAAKNDIEIEYHFDSTCMTHFITRVNGTEADYWYHFSYDARSVNSREILYSRENRWDEALWRPGVWVYVVNGEDLDGLKKEFMEEIEREKQYGHMIPSVSISINPGSYRGNPEGLGRISVSRQFNNVIITPHNMRSQKSSTLFKMPFQPEVVTSMDVPLSLMDNGELDVVTSVFYDYLEGYYIDSYYIVELGFPGIGSSYSSGSQGIVYTTGNGRNGKLVNNADGKLHITSDIHVIHAPDFSNWRWIELGNPYYENADPFDETGIDDESILEDYNSIDRGFNLYVPYPNPFSDRINISYNIFEPGDVNISIFSSSGEKLAILVNEKINNIGIHQTKWTPANISSGRYYVVMKHGANVQERSVVLMK